ncbi:MAG: E3 binding domain-containing protein, partial [Candidatus Rokubacteria bacterium]|nr:E3 binding domain-containing protein [Candidatus Rokubacteria bacterium]
MAVTKVVMPKLSEAMESGKIIKWLKQEGDRIQGGDILAEVETDKADVEMEAFGAGVLRKVLVPAGEKALVGMLIAVIAEPGDDISALLAGAPAPAAPAPAPGPAGAPPAPAPAAGPPAARPATVGVPAVVLPQGGRVKASPLAKKIAAQSGVDLRLLQGSGPGGRIVRRDV